MGDDPSQQQPTTPLDYPDFPHMSRTPRFQPSRLIERIDEFEGFHAEGFGGFRMGKEEVMIQYAPLKAV